MIVYILKSSACLLIFIIIYKLILEKENMHVFKRFYLLGALILSVGIPLITFTYYIEPIIQTTPILVGEGFIQNTVFSPESKTNYLTIILWSTYGLGVFLFGLKFIRNLYNIIYKIKHNPKQKKFSITHVLLNDLIVPHTFFRYIFFNKHKFETKEIPEEVLWHEEIHAKQKHSIDVLFIELLQVLFWFNPLIYLAKHFIKLNHEFLADQGVLNKGIRTTTYQEILLAFSSNASQPQLANAINYSLIKKRFTVMKTQTTKKGVWLRSLILLPLLAITLYGFSDKVVMEKTSDKELTTNLATSNDTETALQEKASKEQIEEYNALAKKYNNMPKDNVHIEKSDIKRLKYLYNLMTDTQRNKAEKFPDIPAPPAPLVAPKAPRTSKPEMPAPPPPLDKNATQKQIKVYKDAQEKHQIAAEAIKMKLQKQQLKHAKLAYKEAQMVSKNLKMRLLKEQLREEKLANRNNQMTTERLKRNKEREKMQKEKMTYRENQIASKLLKHKAEKEKLAKVKRKLSEIDKKKLQLEKEAYRKNLEKARHLKKKADKNRSKKIKEDEKTPRTPETASIDEREQLLRLKREYPGKEPNKIALYSSLNEIEEVKLREVAEVPLKEIEEVKVREVVEVPFEEIEVREIPPPPPPKSPIEHIKEMAEKGSEFYFDGKSVSSKKAINLIRSNKDLNILTNHTDDSNFIVNLSTKPIVIGN